MPAMSALPITVDLAWPLNVLLLSIRLGAALALTPLLQAMNLPVSVRVLLVLVLAVLLTAGFPASRMPAGADWSQLLIAAFHEFLLGVALGLGVTLAFAAFSVAGRLLDLQIGYSIGQAFDPVSRTQATILTSLFNLGAVALFFLTRGHHAVIRGFATVLEHVPVGQGMARGLAAEALFRHAGMMFSLGLALVAPVVLALLLLECGLAMMARSLPQINMLLFGIPLKIALGLAALGLWMGSTAGPAARIQASIFQFWEGVVR